MKEEKATFLRIEKDSAEARGKLEVSGLILLKILNSRTTWLLVLILAAYAGLISTSELSSVLSKIIDVAIEP